jgi:hypothetical protein
MLIPPPIPMLHMIQSMRWVILTFMFADSWLTCVAPNRLKDRTPLSMRETLRLLSIPAVRQSILPKLFVGFGLSLFRSAFSLAATEVCLKHEEGRDEVASQ